MEIKALHEDSRQLYNVLQMNWNNDGTLESITLDDGKKAEPLSEYIIKFVRKS